MHSDFDNWVEEAVDCFEEDGSMMGDNIFKFNSLLQLIVEEWDIDNSNFDISHNSLLDEVRSILRNARDEPNTAQYVRQSKGLLQKKLGTKTRKRYTIVFPLNISFSNWNNPPEKIKIRGELLERVTRLEWKSKYWSSIAGQNAISEFLNKSPNDILSQDFTYWRCRMSAIDRSYAVNKAEQSALLMSAKINFAMNYKRTPMIRSSEGPWPYRWSDLRSPFVYFVFVEGLHLGFYKPEIYRSYFYDDDSSYRDETHVNSFRVEKVENIMSSLPDLPEEVGDVGQVIVDGLLRYQKGITETKNDRAFFSYWRGIETMTLTDKSERMREIPERAISLFDPENPEVFKYRALRVGEIRNKLVHEGQSPQIEEEDLKLLKDILEELVRLFSNFYNEWDLDDFKFVLENGNHNESELDKLKSNHHREIYLIHKFLERRQ